MTPHSVLAFVGLAGCALGADPTPEPQCKSFSEIYPNGEALAHNMWGGAFKYVPESSPDYALAYDMWFNPGSAANPNEAVVRDNILAGKLHENYGDSEHSEQCHLDYFHHGGAPRPMTTTKHVCSPWQDESCCKASTVSSAQTLNEAYGEEFHWDRCGPLSYECEMFFVQENCFYECEPSAGFYRKHQNASVVGAEHPDAYNASDDGHNKWELHEMPMKGDYFDRWLDACSNDKFCSTDSGSLWTCARVYEKARKAAEEALAADLKAAQAERDEAEAALADGLKSSKEKTGDDDDDNKGLVSGAVAGIAVASCVTALALLALVVLVSKEKSGNPVFTKMGSNGEEGGNAGKAEGASMELPGKQVASV